MGSHQRRISRRFIALFCYQLSKESQPLFWPTLRIYDAYLIAFALLRQNHDLKDVKEVWSGLPCLKKSKSNDKNLRKQCFISSQPIFRYIFQCKLRNCYIFSVDNECTGFKIKSEENSLKTIKLSNINLQNNWDSIHCHKNFELSEI